LSDDNGTVACAFMEIFNNSGKMINMKNCTIQRIQSSGTYDNYTYTFQNDLIIPVNGLLVVSRGATQTIFESHWSITFSSLNSVFDSGNDLLYFTTGRSYKLYNSENVLLDSTPNVLKDTRKYQITIGNWSEESNSSTGTPGTLDESQTLPVTLSSFTAIPANNHQAVTLQWVTQSESELFGYYVYRNNSNDIQSCIRQSDLIQPYNTDIEQTYTWTDADISEGQYYYWLMSVERDGSSEMHGPVFVKVGETTPEAPNYTINTAFNSVYPNPFNPSTTLSYSLAEASDVNIKIYNVKGELVHQIYELGKNKGNHSVVWNGKDKNNNACGSGVYFFQLQAGKYQMTKKALLMK